MLPSCADAVARNEEAACVELAPRALLLLGGAPPSVVEAGTALLRAHRAVQRGVGLGPLGSCCVGNDVRGEHGGGSAVPHADGAARPEYRQVSFPGHAQGFAPGPLLQV
eukprot:5761148-Lingulodinium_polyedra.AAC.1